MLVREIKRVLLILVPLFTLLLITAILWRTPSDQYSSLRSKVSQVAGDLTQWTPSNSTLNSRINETHQQIFSLSTPDGRYFPIKFGDLTAFNPSIIPHPQLGSDTFLIVAQKRRVNPDGTEPADTSVFNVEIGCTASFITSPSTGSVSLECIDHPEILPIAATPGNKCTGSLSYISWNIGPHDARVFWGPKKPLIIFGSNSQHACFGMFLQDFRVLVDWKPVTFGEESFRMARELERPPPWGVIEKNWFVWWDGDGGMYVHYEIFPRRVFARVDGNGAAGRDLGGLIGKYSAEEEEERKERGGEGRVRGKKKGKGKDGGGDWNRDTRCMERYFPRLPRNGPEDIHQATNSLRVTLCNRRGNRTTTPAGEQENGSGYHGAPNLTENGEEAECTPNSDNTVIMTIVHHKTYYDYHGEYEPYVVLFRQMKPFELYGISRKPLWIHGRERQSAKRSDMFYVASVSWKEKGKGYHGFLDDVVFLGFGIEDRWSGGMDLTMGSLLEGIGLC